MCAHCMWRKIFCRDVHRCRQMSHSKKTASELSRYSVSVNDFASNVDLRFGGVRVAVTVRVDTISNAGA